MTRKPQRRILPMLNETVLLGDEGGGWTWWCGKCGAKGMGRYLPDPTAEPETRRLATAHKCGRTA